MAMTGLRGLLGRMRDSRHSGQMTVEMMGMLPVAIMVAVIAMNALLFIGDCAAFDRTARNAIRVYATSPTYGVHAGQSQARIEAQIQAQVNKQFEQVSVSYEGMGGGLTRYTATLDYAPNLFGLGLRDSVLGVAMPHLHHSTSLVVDTYKPGVFFE